MFCDKQESSLILRASHIAFWQLLRK